MSNENGRVRSESRKIQENYFIEQTKSRSFPRFLNGPDAS